MASFQAFLNDGRCDFTLKQFKWGTLDCYSIFALWETDVLYQIQPWPLFSWQYAYHKLCLYNFLIIPLVFLICGIFLIVFSKLYPFYTINFIIHITRFVYLFCTQRKCLYFQFHFVKILYYLVKWLKSYIILESISRRFGKHKANS